MFTFAVQDFRNSMNLGLQFSVPPLTVCGQGTNPSVVRYWISPCHCVDYRVEKWEDMLVWKSLPLPHFHNHCVLQKMKSFARIIERYYG